MQPMITHQCQERLRDRSRHDVEVKTGFPADLFPEPNSTLVFVEDEDMAFADPGILQGGEAFFNKVTANSLAPMGRVDREMVNISPSPIVTAEDSPDDDTLPVPCEKTHARVSVEIGEDVLPVIGIAEADPFRFLPEGHDVVIIVNR